MRKLKVNREDAKTKIKTHNQKNRKEHTHTLIHKERRKIPSASISLCHSAIYRNFRRSRMTQSSTKSWNSKQQQQQSQKKKRPDETTTAAKPKQNQKSEWKSEEFERQKKKKKTLTKIVKKPQLWSILSCPFFFGLLLLLLQKNYPIFLKLAKTFFFVCNPNKIHHLHNFNIQICFFISLAHTQISLLLFFSFFSFVFLKFLV